MNPQDYTRRILKGPHRGGARSDSNDWVVRVRNVGVEGAR